MFLSLEAMRSTCSEPGLELVALGGEELTHTIRFCAHVCVQAKFRKPNL